MKWLAAHPYASAVVATWILNNVISALVSSLPAPTKDSSPKYVYWFKVANTIIGNLRRAQSTAIENSPNWAAAVAAHLEKVNGTYPPPSETRS
jgi:hypothetical protein